MDASNHRRLTGDRLAAVAYWPARMETAADCGIRLAKCLTALGAAGPKFSAWYRLGRGSTATELKPVVVDAGHLAEILQRGRNRRDTDRGVIEQLGFQCAFLNSHRMAGAVSLHATCGIYSENQRLWNAVVVSPLDPGSLGCGVAVELVRAAVAAWQPQWAAVCTRSALRARAAGHMPVVDWVVYVRLAAVPTLPPPARSAFVDGGPCVVVRETPHGGEGALFHAGEVARSLGI